MLQKKPATKKCRIAVVIPFYQKKAGLLLNCVESIKSQVTMPLIDVVIVDDGSLISASADLRNFSPSENMEIVILKQENKGVAAARNKALKWIVEKSEANLIAFLDSDDCWNPTHLMNALIAFDCEADFYFANVIKQSSNMSMFDDIGFIGKGQSVGNLYKSIFEYTDDYRSLFSKYNPLQTPAIVVRKSIISDVQFDMTFYNCGEDQWFFYETLLRSKRVFFSEDIGCVLGKGVNIYAGIRAGTSKAIIKDMDEIQLRYRMLQHSNKEYSEYLKEKITRSRESLIYNLFSCVKTGETVPYARLLSHISYDLLFPLKVLMCLFKKIIPINETK